MRATVFRANSRLIVLMLILVHCSSCKWGHNEQDIEFYEKEFKKNYQTFDSLSNYLLIKYGKDSSLRSQVRLILLNPSKQRKTLQVEKVDSNILRWLNATNVRSLNIEGEDSACMNGYYVDKIYFLLYKEVYYPPVYYIYSTCVFDSINRSTQKVKRKTINPHWDVLIDNS